MIADAETLWVKGEVADCDHYSTFEGGERREAAKKSNRAEGLDSDVVRVKERYSLITLL